jgi:uncharacterized protein YegP (UPF0339 family)
MAITHRRFYAKTELRFYEAKDGWRWRLKNKRNKKIIAESGESYSSKSHAKRAMRYLPFSWLHIDVIEE